uniref:Double zinc ribbon and ankyrin repeat domains 1 n=1 Tax=Xiphophorus couchianus TaxID=32473 RepID=A0A3B5LY03_9TELE
MAAGAISTPLIIPISEGVTRKPKTRIDTRTPVCIQSDSPGVLIFFTLDGSKPVAGQRGSEVGSRKYTGPVLLPAGRVSVRANIFAVGLLSVYYWCIISIVVPHLSTGEHVLVLCVSRCPRCLCVCPSDPFARFCSQCGAVIPPVPTLRPPPAGRGQVLHSSTVQLLPAGQDRRTDRLSQLLPCPSCRCLVPINSRTCWTCEASTEGTRAGFSLQVSSRCIAVSNHGSGTDGTRTSTKKYSHRVLTFRRYVQTRTGPGLPVCVAAGRSGWRRRPLWWAGGRQHVVLLQVPPSEPP